MLSEKQVPGCKQRNLYGLRLGRRFGLGWAEKITAHTAGQFKFPLTAENIPIPRGGRFRVGILVRLRSGAAGIARARARAMPATIRHDAGERWYRENCGGRHALAECYPSRDGHAL